jgi:hypothetical protein
LDEIYRLSEEKEFAIWSRNKNMLFGIGGITSFFKTMGHGGMSCQLKTARLIIIFVNTIFFVS